MYEMYWDVWGCIGMCGDVLGCMRCIGMCGDVLGCVRCIGMYEMYWDV